MTETDTRRQSPARDGSAGESDASGVVRYQRLVLDVPEHHMDAIRAQVFDVGDVLEVQEEKVEPPDDPECALVFALARAQAAFPQIQKNKTAEVRKNGEKQYDYKYADLGDVLAAVRPVLARNGLALVQRTHHDESGKVILTTKLRHVAGAEETSVVELGQSSTNPQAFGGALTYLRRYEAVTLLGIAAEEDTDAQHVEPAPRSNGNSLPAWAREATKTRKEVALVSLSTVVGHDAAVSILTGMKAHYGLVPDLVPALVKVLAVEFEKVRQDAQAERSDLDGSSLEPEASSPDPEPSPVDRDESVPPASAQLPQASVKPDDPLAREVCTCPEGFDAAADDPEKRDDGCPVETHGIPF